MTLYVILTFLSVLAGMAIAVRAFGTGGKRAKVFDDIYFSVEDVDGTGIIYTKSGDLRSARKWRKTDFSDNDRICFG